VCFSPTAAATTATIGLATLRQVNEPREVPLAGMPLLFASQQAVEGFLWLHLSGQNDRTEVATLSLIFLIFAKVLWPAYTPIAVLLIEADRRRKRALFAITLIGCTISIYVLTWLFAIPSAAAICGHSIDYGGSKNPFSWQSFPYLLCTCVPLLLSSQKTIQVFGATVLVGFWVSAYTFSAAFISVWCFYAAAGSMMIYFYFKRAAKRVGFRHN
jgi:hypothetical protein